MSKSPQPYQMTLPHGINSPVSLDKPKCVVWAAVSKNRNSLGKVGTWSSRDVTLVPRDTLWLFHTMYKSVSGDRELGGNFNLWEKTDTILGNNSAD